MIAHLPHGRACYDLLDTVPGSAPSDVAAGSLASRSRDYHFRLPDVADIDPALPRDDVIVRRA
jgi:hypothetical protein